MTAIAPPPFIPLATNTPALGAQALAVLQALAACPGVEYDMELHRVDANGAVLQDLTPYLLPGGNPVVRRSCASELAGTCTLSLSTPLVWGYDLVQPAMLISSPFYNGGSWQRFPLGVYVVTTPTQPLLDSEPYQVSGYEKTYLLQSDIGDSFLAASGSVYSTAVKALFVAAGVLASGGNLADVCDYPGDWFVKTLPSDMAFPLTGSGSLTYLQIVNQLLAASGMRMLFTDQNGRFQIVSLPVPASQPQQWAFARTESSYAPGFPANSVVSDVNNSISRDVFGVVNQWVFIQQGLTFQPIEGSGQYTVNNTTHRPSDQTSVKRIIRSVQLLSASGQADLVKQGDAIVAATYAQGEGIAIESAPWPVGWHYDVFWYADEELPDTDLRKVQSQGWTLPLGGGKMTWTTLVVAPQ